MPGPVDELKNIEVRAAAPVLRDGAEGEGGLP